MKVEYAHAFTYRYDPDDGQRYPILALELAQRVEPTRRVATWAYLDSGCTRSVFDGRLAPIIGIDPTQGPRIAFTTATGVSIQGILHPVRLVHPDLGSFDLEIGFVQILLRRNLLGRDFLNFVQLGLREHLQEFYLTAAS